ncbi:amidohydrolase family protein [Pontixanthobacter aquaemixtae]|uniref:Amidohydrolase family protein n=1 Tax=Pontixanthobacter aquaemixtae TaxID=1958940 RepID=A0A844ZLS6_9SPHN|nr:amidohydrolase family protein [Pontixanthobacter aquaemixtae]MXO89361.1 amidohydrolase family protein [Pontixanthobacter aquaemixtae]
MKTAKSFGKVTGVASVLAGLLFATSAYAQDAAEAPEEELAGEAAETGKKGWDVNAPEGATIKQVPINVDEGSWMDVDVSPDGGRIAFSLLGDIYTMPISGGTPTRIAEGLAWEVQPRWSPDGSQIAFTSDRGGGDNIWVMDAAGGNARQVTKESFRLTNQPTWSPDGRFIAAKKHFTTGRSLGTGEIWLYHVSGGGGVKLVKRPNESHQKELGEPTYSPDGKAIYYTRNTTPGGTFIYAQDSNAGIFDIERYDLTTGEISTAVSGYGGAVRPAPSPDGTKIAFVRREQDQSRLFVKDIASGRETKIYDDLDKDVQETWAVTGVYPNMDWTPDSRSIIFWAGGKIRRVNADGSGASVIPFSISDTRGVADAPHPVIEVAPDSFTTSIPKFASVSPDGRQVVFETLGKLYIKSTSGGGPRRLTSGGGDAIEAFPSWSRDGRKIVFVRWTDQGLGSIVTVGSNGSGETAVTSQPGHYGNPVFSPDGRTIVFEKRSGGYLTSPEWSENTGVYRVSASGGAPALVAQGKGSPQFGEASDRLFMTGGSGSGLQLVSTDLNGEAQRVHAQGEMVNAFTVSPDGKFLAFRENYEAFAMPLMPGGQMVSVSAGANALPVAKASSGGADYMGWSNNGGTLNWSMGPTLYSAAISAMFPKVPAQGDNAYSPPQSGISLSMTRNAAKPSGAVVLTGATLLTMTGEGAGRIEGGTIVIEGDRITAVGGPDVKLAIPAGAKQIDMSGKIIMPGLVDAHAHGAQGTGDLVPQQNWALVQNLAMGTTTIHDPSSSASQIFAASERQQAGTLLAPRIFSTGEIIYGAKSPSVYAEINDYEDALGHVRRIKAQGGISVKNYNQPRREQRQQVARAAAAENMLVVAEGGSLFGMDMNLVADGNSTVEHNVPLDIFYDDVVQVFSQSQTNYTPTLTVTYGGLGGDPYWRQAQDVWKNPLLVHTPPKRLLADNARRTLAPEWAFVDDDNAREAKKLADAGVKVSIGAHGQQAGIAAHWELWSFVRGGMTPTEALRAGTIIPAQSLGMDRDIGSIEAGKLADLIVLSADPTADIQHSDDIEKVMLGGRLYDATTMNEVETGNAKRLPYWWE